MSPHREHRARMEIYRGVGFLVAWCLVAIAPAAAAQQTVFTFNPSATRVQFTLGATLHTVHGTMKLESGEIRFDPATGNASGQVIVDATSAETGNKSRDNKMHKEILKSDRFKQIVFTAQHIIGAIQPTGTSTVQLSGSFELEGTQHPLTLPVTIERPSETGAASASTKFSVPYIQWGVKNPSTLFLRVSDHVDMEIDATGQFSTAH
jgi:polyisoprenoid-binding protein YceI